MVLQGMNEERQYLRAGGKTWHVSVSKDLWFNTELSRDARSLWLTLYFFVGPNNYNPFPSQAKLCTILGCHRDTLRVYIKELEKKHYLSRYRDPFKVTIYTIYSDPKEWSPAVPVELEYGPNGKPYVKFLDEDAPGSRTDRPDGAAENFGNHAEKSVTAMPKNPPCIMPKIPTREPSKNTTQEPDDEADANVTDRAKDSPVLKNIPIEGAASPPAADFSLLGKPELSQSKSQEQVASREVIDFVQQFTPWFTLITGKRAFTFTPEALMKAKEFFIFNDRWIALDVIYVAVKALTEVKLNPFKGGKDKLWWCRTHGEYPNRYFSCNHDEEYILLRMKTELGFDPDQTNDDREREEIKKMAAPYLKKK